MSTSSPILVLGGTGTTGRRVAGARADSVTYVPDIAFPGAADDVAAFAEAAAEIVAASGLWTGARTGVTP